jgi:hypothetical protein
VKRPHRQQGSVLLGVLLLGVLVTSVTLGYARHVLISASNARATVAVQEAESVADSGLAWARQTLLADGALTGRLALDAGSSVAVDLVDGDSGTKTLTIASNVGGQKQSLVGSLQTYAAVGSTLPSLTSASRSVVGAHGSVTSVSGTQTLSNTTINGLLFLQNGANVTLQNCIVAGTIVSQPALSTTGWRPVERTRLTLSGTIVVESDASLAGVSIIAPDCTLTGDGTEAVQIQGVVVVAALSLSGWGAISGQVATSGTPVLAAAIDLPGAGREQRAWPAALDTNSEAIGKLSFPKVSVTAGQILAMKNFTFPTRVLRGP